ncbi:MAG: glycosyltransferase family 2 protein [Bdellovibrionales bacterium]
MFVFPMAGLSQRFIKAGYELPKYRLKAGGQSIFGHVLSGFSAYFKTDTFLFICRDVADTPAFVEKECKALGIKSYEIVVLSEPTRGQAETVFLGLKQKAVSEEEPLTIFNIDTIHPDFQHPIPEDFAKMDGYLEVFQGPGDAWSFARTKSPTDNTVVETAEKRRISPYCSTGLYYFRRAAFFYDSYEKEVAKPEEEWDAKELYIAPLYNDLIASGKVVKAVEIPFSFLIPCGVPDEYEAFKKACDNRT